MADKIYYGFIATLAVITLCGSLALAYRSDQMTKAFDTVCKAKGGVMVLGQPRPLCVKASAFIAVE